jgi:hypothetical protein
MNAAEDNLARFPGVETFARSLSKYTVEDFDTLEPAAMQSRVKGLWPAVGLVFVGGPSMSGKSFWTLDALARVCRGDPVLGHKSKAAGCLYIAAEGASGVRNRIAGLRSRIGKLDGGFGFIGQAPNLTDPEDVATLRDTIMEVQAERLAAGLPLGVVAIDTLSASIPGADENSAKDMSLVLHALQSMAADLGLLVVVIAHTGKDEGRGLRGWSGLLANADGLVMLESPDGSTRAGNIVKVKDGEAGQRFAFSLERVVVGFDEDGDEITTCVINPEDAPAKPKAGRKPTAAQADADILKTAFNRILANKGSDITAPGANGANGVHLPDLRTEALKNGLGPEKPDLTGMDEKQARTARKAWLDHRNKTFDRAKKNLMATGRYRIEDEWIWEKDPNKGDPA